MLFLTLEYPPYASSQLPEQGVAVQLLRDMLQGSEFEPVVEFVPWSRVLHEMKEGRADGALLLWPEESKRFNVLMSSPLFISRLGFYVRSDVARYSAVNLPSLKRKRVCAVRGYGYPPELAAAGVLFDEALTDEANLERLSKGRCDYVALEQAVGRYILDKPEAKAWRNRVQWQGPAFAELPLTFGVTGNKPHAKALHQALEQGFLRLKTSQRYQQLLSQQGLELPH